MPSFTLNGFSSVARTLTNGDSGFITQNGALVSLGAHAITATGAVDFTVLGTLAAQSVTHYNAFSFTGTATTFTVGAQGHVSSNGDTISALATSSMSVFNAGTIQTGEDGVDLRHTDNSARIDVINSGIIHAGSDGTVTDSGTQSTSIINTGQILAGDAGVYNGFSDTTGAFSLVNSGEIIGDVHGYLGNSADQTIYNTGLISGIGQAAVQFVGGTNFIDNTGGQITGDILGGSDNERVLSGDINGDVFLNDGVDVFRGDGDTTLTGEIHGGDGNDRLFGGDNSDTMYGDGDADKMRGRDGDDDLYGGLADDNIRGQGGDDYIEGNQGNDTLSGGRGNDQIKGGSGNDTITGGAGEDVLTGNSGADVFVFTRRSGDDEITDFSNNVDRLDLSAFGVTSRADLTSAGAIVANGAGSIIDLTTIGGDGVIYVEDMGVGQWGNTDFIF